MGRKWRVLTALLLGFALVAGACGSDDDEEAAPAATTAAPAATTAAPAATTAAPDVGGLDELDVAYFLEWPTANQVAQLELTYDDALGIPVVWHAFASGNDMALAMEAGDIDISYSQGLTPFANYVTSGAEHEIVGVAVSYADADNCVAHPDYGVTAANAAESLAGQNIYTPIGNVTHFKLLKMLEHLGVSLDSFSLIPSEGGSAAVAAFNSGDVAMACAFGGAVNQMVADGGNLVMTGSEQEAIGIRVFDIISIPMSFGDDHPDVVTAFLQVTEDANAAYSVDRASMEATIAEAAGMEVGPSNALLDAFTFLDKATQLSDAWLGGTVQQVMKDQMDFFVEQEEITTALDSYAPFVNTSFLEAVTDAPWATAAPAGEPFRLGFAADFSDLGGFADIPASEAAIHFVELINCSGGIDIAAGFDIDRVLATDLMYCDSPTGTMVELTIQNIEGDPEVTQRAGQDLIDAGVSVILGPPFPDFGEPLLQVTAGQIPVLFVASTEPSLADPDALSFLVAFDDTAQATAGAKFALNRGWSTAVTFSAPGPYFGYNPEIFTEVFEAGGGTVINDYNFVPIDDMDFSTQANAMAAAGEQPDVVYSAMLSFQAAVLRGQLDAAGVDTHYLITDAFEATGGYFTDGVEGFFHTTHSFPAEGSRIKALADSFEAANGRPLENASFGGLAVDAIAVAIDAYVRTGSMDPGTLGAAIAQGAGIVGATGELTYSGAGSPAKPVYVHEVVGGAPSLAATITAAGEVLAATTAVEGIRIAVVAPSASNDLAFSQSIVDGVNALSGVDEISITDGTFIVDDAAAAVRDYAEDGYDLVIAHGSQYGGFLSEMAPDFPDTAFAWGTSGDTFGLDNVSAYTASSDQGGYVMGAMAAAMTYSRVIGVIGPIEVGDAKLYVDGFVAGAAAQDPGVSVNVNYIMSFSDVALAAEAAQAHIANRADILTGTAQMVVGATGVAAEHGAKWFGTQSNQTALGEDMVVASQVYKWEVVLQGIVDGIAAGDLGGEAHDINLGNGGLVIEFNDGVDAGDARAIADAAIAAIIAGGVDTTYTPPPPKSGGTLVQASTQVGTGINHGVKSGVAIGNPSSKIFAPLVHLDANWQPQPYLAESWEVSEDELTVTLHLVEGATFHDGVPITSADVKFSIEVVKNNHPFTGMWGALDSIDTPDDLTVVLNLANPHPALWIAMSDVLMPVMPKHIMDDGTPINEMTGHPNNTAALEGDLIAVGSGPFVLKEWDPTQKVVLEAYEDFFIPGRPYLDSIIYVIVPDEDAALLGLESGEYDTAGYASVLNEQKVLNNPDVVAIPYAGGVGALNHLQFNMANDIMSDLRVRQAIAYTIDRDYVINTLHQGMTRELLGGIYPDSPFYNPNVERYDVDLDKARALLAEAGYADGLELRIHYIPGPNEQQRNVAEYIAQALGEVGVDVEVVNSADAGAWVGIFFGGPDAWQMTMTAYFNWGDPVIGVQRAYVCDNIKVSFFVNNSAYCNERVDELLYAAAAEPDFDARKALYDEFQEITAIELPFYNINALPIFGARQPDVMNLPTGPWGNLSGMENVWLDR